MRVIQESQLTGQGSRGNASQDAQKGRSARPQRATIYCLYLRGGRDDSNCAQRSHPPTHWHAETCHLPGRGPSSSLYLPLEEWPRLPSTARIERYIAPLRFTLGMGSLIFHCARPTRAFSGRALREHRRSSGSIPSSVLRARRVRCSPILLKPRVARARGSSQLPHILFQHPVKGYRRGLSIGSMATARFGGEDREEPAVNRSGWHLG